MFHELFTYHDVDYTLLVAISPEGVAVLLTIHVDALPPELLNGNERLVDVCVLRHEVCSQVQGEAFRMEDVRGCLREDYSII